MERFGPVGVKDVAARAGVSVGTVSNVLNRPEKVSDTTRDRVQAAIDELGFVRNEAARQLRAGLSNCVGLIVLNATNPFFNDIAAGAEEVAAEHGVSVLVGNSAEIEEGPMGFMLEDRFLYAAFLAAMAEEPGVTPAISATR